MCSLASLIGVKLGDVTTPEAELDFSPVLPPSPRERKSPPPPPLVLYPPPPVEDAGPIGQAKEKGLTLGALIGIIAGSIVVFMALMYMLLTCRSRRRITVKRERLEGIKLFDGDTQPLKSKSMKTRSDDYDIELMR